MAQIITRPQRFTPDEWKIANKIKHKNAERTRAATERLIAESDRLDGETREQTDTTLDDVNKKIGNKLLTKRYNRNLALRIGQRSLRSVNTEHSLPVINYQQSLMSV